MTEEAQPCRQSAQIVEPGEQRQPGRQRRQRRGGGGRLAEERQGEPGREQHRHQDEAAAARHRHADGRSGRPDGRGSRAAAASRADARSVPASPGRRTAPPPRPSNAFPAAPSAAGKPRRSVIIQRRAAGNRAGQAGQAPKADGRRERSPARPIRSRSAGTQAERRRSRADACGELPCGTRTHGGHGCLHGETIWRGDRGVAVAPYSEKRCNSLPEISPDRAIPPRSRPAWSSPSSTRGHSYPAAPPRCTPRSYKLA